MSSLRRRILGSPSPSPSPIHTPDPNNTTQDDLKLIPTEKLDKLKSARKGHKRRVSIFFFLGGIFGVFIAGFFAQQQDVINLEGLLDLNLDSLIDVIPAGIINDAKDLTVCLLAIC
jgi:phospholipid:diacylglycerol acyltransferase